MVPVKDVRIADAADAASASEKLKSKLASARGCRTARTTGRRRTCRSSLKLDKEGTAAEAEEAAEKTCRVQTYPWVGHTIAKAGHPLTPEAAAMLRAEHELMVGNLSAAQGALRFAASVGMFVALFTLCGSFIFRREPRLLYDPGNSARSWIVLTFSVLVASVVATDNWRAEMIPVLVFGMTIAIAYRQELPLCFRPRCLWSSSLRSANGCPTTWS